MSWVSLDKAQEVLGVSRFTIRRWCREGLIPDNSFIQMGKEWKVKPQLIEKYFAKETKKKGGKRGV